MITDSLRKRNESKANKLHSQGGVAGTRTHSSLKLLTLVCLFLFVVAFSPDSATGSTGVTQTYTISGQVTDYGFGNAVSGATVFLSGTQTGTTTTNNHGLYSFSNLQAGGNYNLSASIPGRFDTVSFGVTVNNLSSDLTQNLQILFFVTFHIWVKDALGVGIAGVGIRVNNDSFIFAQTNTFGLVNIGIGSPITRNGPPATFTPQKPGYIFNPPSVTLSTQNGDQTFNFTASISNVTNFFQFSTDRFTVNEGDGAATITVTRTGDTSTAVGVSYFTADAGLATQKSDYVMATGTLNFAPGETIKTFKVLIIDNAYPTGNHGLFLQLINPTGGALLTDPSIADLTIIDNDTATPTTNPLDDSQFFVREHYYDFLDRLPDQGGLDYWTNQIARCGSDANCLKSTRVGVSAAFFIEQEFQQTGSVVYRIHKAALGSAPSYGLFMQDRNRLIGGPQLQQSTLDFANGLVQRSAFTQSYPDSMTPADFVNKLFDTAALSPYTAERQQEIQALSGGRTRAQVLLDVMDIPEFKNREYNPAFVLMQYYGYLRRDPDPGGYAFWLNVLNNKLPHDDSGYRAMVCAFITSFEYQDRFSPVRTHSNADCGP